MSLIKWNDKYSVNNEHLDNDHKKLFEMFNRLYDNCVTEGNNGIWPMLDELIVFSSNHCRAEEEFMASIGYMEIESHTQKHRQILRKLTQLKDADINNEYEISKELIVLIGNWIRLHIIDEDKKFSVQVPA